MKKILILFTTDSVKSQMADPKALVELLNKGATLRNQKIAYEYAYFDDLLHIVSSDDARIIDTVSGNDLSTYGAVYLRRWAELPAQGMACAIYLRNKNVSVVDREAIGVGSHSKLTQYWRLWEAGLPIPKSVFVPQSKILEWMHRELGTTIAFPCIMKSVHGTRGQDNHLVHRIADAEAIIKNNPEKEYIIQEYIPNEGDYRVFVVGGKLRLVIYRQAAVGSHKNNISQGGSAILVERKVLPVNVRRACIKAASKFNRDIAGVDVVLDVRDPKRFYFFEVNRSPQIDASSFSEEKADVLNEYFGEVLAKSVER